MLEPPRHSPMQAINRPPYRYRPHKGEQQTGTACAGGPRAAHLVHMLSPLVGLIFGFFASVCKKNQNTWSYSPDRPKLAEISARSFKT